MVQILIFLVAVSFLYLWYSFKNSNFLETPNKVGLNGFISLILALLFLCAMFRQISFNNQIIGLCILALIPTLMLLYSASIMVYVWFLLEVAGRIINFLQDRRELFLRTSKKALEFLEKNNIEVTEKDAKLRMIENYPFWTFGEVGVSIKGGEIILDVNDEDEIIETNTRIILPEFDIDEEEIISEFLLVEEKTKLKLIPTDYYYKIDPFQ